MAITQNQYTGDGTTVLFTIAFPYLERDHVKASLNGTPTTAFTFANSNTIQFNVAPANGVTILLFRETESGELQNQFFPNSSIPSSSLNNNFTQGLYVAQETDNTSNQALSDAQNAVTTANGAVVTANAADAKSDQAILDSAAAVVTANTAESNSLAAVSTANAASSAASAAVSTANSASSTASSAVSTANAASATATQASIDAAAAVVTANQADADATQALSTANQADSNASAAVSTANQAAIDAAAAVVTAGTAESNSLSAISTANSAAAAVSAAVLYQPVIDLAALALLTPTDGDFFELQDSTGADTDPSITGIPVGLVGAAGLTFRLRYDDPPGEYVFLGYFANDSETRYLKTGTGTVTSTNILDGTILNADINASAAIAGTKISPDFGSQNVTTTGTATAASLNPTGSSVPTNGVYLPAANNVAISTNGTGRLFIGSAGGVGVGTATINSELQFTNVVGTTGGANKIRLYDSAGTVYGIGVQAGGVNYRGDSHLFYAANGTSEYARIDSSGRLGLGSSTPDALLTVNGVGAHGLGSVTAPSFAFTGDLNTGFWSPAADTIAASTGGSERARIDSSGRLLVGTSTSRASALNANGNAFQVIGSQTLWRASDDANAQFIEFVKGRAASAVVVDNDLLGQIQFEGSDGTNPIRAAAIQAAVDGTPGTNDMPGRLVFSTTADGASSPTERMRIDSAGSIGVGTTSTSGYNLRLGKNLTGGSGFARGASLISTVQSDVTGSAWGFQSEMGVQDASFTLPELVHFFARQGTKGASATLTAQYGFFAASSITGATNNYGFYSNIASSANSWNFYAAGTADNYFAGKIASLGSYNDTTASAANVFIASNGDIQRSTSSIRYKTDVETLEQSYADNVILNARPVWYRSLCEADNSGWSYYGLIAEEIAELDPRLVFWGRPTKEVLQEEAKDAVLDDEGNVVEPAREATYTNVEDTEAELRPEGVQYDRLTVMLIDVVQRQQKAIEVLEAKVASLEGL